MREFRIRASACGKIMTNGKKKDELSVGAKTYCENWYKEQLYKKRKIISSKYLSKGLIQEDIAIDLVADYYGWGLVTKNEQFFSNDFMQGTPDLVLGDCIPDIKNSWDFATFPLLEKEIKNKDYYWQLQVYMELCKKDRAELIYVLMDAPEHLIQSEARRQSFQLGYDELDQEFYDSIKEQMTYSDTQIALRIKRYEVERNQSDIDQIYKRVKMCRQYLKTIEI